MPTIQPNSIQVLLLPQQAKDSVLIDAVLKSPQNTVLKQQIIALIVKLWKEFRSIEQAISASLKTLESTKLLEAKLIALKSQSPTAEKNAEINAEMLQARLVQLQEEITKLESALTKEVAKYKSLCELRDAILAIDPSRKFHETLAAQTKADVAAGVKQMLENMSPALTKTLSDKGITSEQLIEDITTTVVQPKETVLQIEKRVADSRKQANLTDTRTLHDILGHHSTLSQLRILIPLRAALKKGLGPLLSSAEINELVKVFFSVINMKSNFDGMEENIRDLFVQFRFVSEKLDQSGRCIGNLRAELEDVSKQLGLSAQTTAATSGNTLRPQFGGGTKPQDDKEQQNVAAQRPSPGASKSF